MSIPGLATHHCLGNGLNHMHIMECPNGHKISHSSESSLTSKHNSTRYMTECLLYSYQTQLFKMVLCARCDLVSWESTFIVAGISAASAKIYTQTFSSKEITRDSLHMLDHTMLKVLDIKNMGDVLAILKLTKEPPVSPTSHITPLTVKLPQLNSEITLQQFHKFRIDWDVFTRMTNLPTTQTNSQLYNWDDKTV